MNALTFSEMSKQGLLLATKMGNVATKMIPVAAAENCWLLSSNILIIRQKWSYLKKTWTVNLFSPTMKSLMDWKWQYFVNPLYKPADHNPHSSNGETHKNTWHDLILKLQQNPFGTFQSHIIHKHRWTQPFASLYQVKWFEVVYLNEFWMQFGLQLKLVVTYFTYYHFHF